MARRRHRGDPKRAVAYIRVSTRDQELGPEAQRAAIERWAAASGVDVVAWCEDLGVSGAAALDKRPGLLSAIEGLSVHNAGALVVAKRDRLARDVIVAAMVERLAQRVGAQIVSADGAGNGSGPEAELMRLLLSAFAQYERHMIAARTKAALAIKRSRGEKTGGSLPLGFDAVEGKLVPHATEAHVLAYIAELRAQGRGARSITRILNAQHVPARGKKWWRRSIERLLARAA